MPGRPTAETAVLHFAMPNKPPLSPMEARSVEEIPGEAGWQYEPKWDGFRCLAFRWRNFSSCESKSGQVANSRQGSRTDIFLQSKAGQPLARYASYCDKRIEQMRTRIAMLQQHGNPQQAKMMTDNAKRTLEVGRKLALGGQAQPAAKNN